MFHFSYWPEGLSVELNKQLVNFHYQAQLCVDSEIFLAIANRILKAQVSGKYFELIVSLPKGYRTFENANLLHRIARAGAKVGVMELTTFNPAGENFGIFDNKLIFSDKLSEEAEDLQTYFLRKNQEFNQLMSYSRPVTIHSEGLQISFYADGYFVDKGSEITVFWNVANANSIVINPGKKMVEESGTLKIQVREDLLLTLEAKNEKNSSVSSLFIKCLDEESLKITVLVYDTESESFVPIDSVLPNEQIFAVYKNDLVKVEWVCKLGGTLFETGLGKLPAIGQHQFICMENKQLNFEINHSNSVYQKQIAVYVTPKEESLPHAHFLTSNGKNTFKKKNANLEEIQNYLVRFINFILAFKSKA